MNKEIPRYDFKIEYALDNYYSVPIIEPVGSLTGKYCLAYHIDELEDEIFYLRTKYNDWSDKE